MTTHYHRDISSITYTGEDVILSRDLKLLKTPEVKKGDVLILPLKSAKFLTRKGNPYEPMNIDLLDGIETSVIEQISDDAKKSIDEQKVLNAELSLQLETLKQELEAYETREHDEVNELKALNAELNEKLENKTPVKKATTKKATTKKEETTSQEES